MIRRVLAVLISASLLAAMGAVASAAPLTPRPIDLNNPYKSADYGFLDGAVGDRPVVALGESIHVTQEMPKVRLNLVRYLHEEKGFDTLAFEGSLIDAWTAQEHAYASAAPLDQRAASFTREALFGLWQTAPMQEVVAYALSTQSGPHPLYLASFDLQPGSGRAYGGSAEDSLKAFVAALRTFDPGAQDQRSQGWISALGPALDCKTPLTHPAALDELTAWIDGPVLAGMKDKRPATHLAALKLAPSMLRARLQHCDQWLAANRSITVYQQARDELNAKTVLALLDASPKLMLWAHHSHLNYNSLGRSIPSMGQHLKAALGEKIYTVGLFAFSGSAMDSSKADTAKGLAMISALAARPLPHDGRFSAERSLAGLSSQDFFVDLKDAPPDWAAPRVSRLERDGQLPTALSKDFDAAILLHRVHGAELDFMAPGPRAVIRLAGWIYQHLAVIALVVVLAIAALGREIFALWRRTPGRGR